jgi:hypothetical protein
MTGGGLRPAANLFVWPCSSGADRFQQKRDGHHSRARADGRGFSVGTDRHETEGSTIMATKVSDIRALTPDELDTVSGGAERQYYRFEMFGYGLALQLGDDKCITVITPDEDTIVCL